MFANDIISSCDDPCLVKSKLFFNYYESGIKKRILQWVDVSYVLGYAKLRIQADLNEI